MLMARNQRDYILAHVDKHLMEWGSGGTTTYFAKHLKGKRLTSIEHNRKWFDKLNCDYEHHDYRLIEPDVEGMKDHDGFNDYISVITDADTLLIDGMARGSCLMWAYHHYPQSVVFLHDAQRSCYDWAVEAYSRAEWIQADKGDYPPLLMKLVR